MRSFVLKRHIPAPIDVVWGVVTDHCGLPNWLTPGSKVHLRVEGQPDRNGVGAVRVINSFGYIVEEEVLAFEAPKRMEYTVLKGFPVRNHRGEMALVENGSGTDVSWSVEFEPALPGLGGVAQLIAKGMLGAGLKRLSTRIDKLSPAS